MSKIDSLIPFMGAKELKELAIKIINGEVKGIKLYKLYPFLNQEAIKEVVQLLIDNKKGSQIKFALPFLSEDLLLDVLNQVRKGDIDDMQEEYFYPFLGKDQIKELFNEYVKEASVSEDSEEDVEEE
jgi:hypothetical protein